MATNNGYYRTKVAGALDYALQINKGEKVLLPVYITMGVRCGITGIYFMCSKGKVLVQYTLEKENIIHNALCLAGWDKADPGLFSSDRYPELRTDFTDWTTMGVVDSTITHLEDYATCFLFTAQEDSRLVILGDI